MKKANVIISLILLGFTGFYAFLTSQLPDRNLPNTLGGDFIPWTLTILLVFFSTALLLISFFEKSEQKQIVTSLKEIGGILLLVGFIALYVRVMLVMGFLATTPVFMAIIMRIIGAKNIKEIVIFSIATTLLVYLLFSKIFVVVLPVNRFF